MDSLLCSNHSVGVSTTLGKVHLAARTGREPATAFLDKHRSEGVVTGGTVAGEVEGRTAVIIDDLIASGTTIGRVVHACRDRAAPVGRLDCGAGLGHRAIPRNHGAHDKPTARRRKDNDQGPERRAIRHGRSRRADCDRGAARNPQGI